MRPINDAVTEICRQAIPLTETGENTERVSLINLTGRILAEDIYSAINVPPA